MGLTRCRVDNDFFHIGFLEGIKNSVKVTFVAPSGESLIDVIPVAEKIR